MQEAILLFFQDIGTPFLDQLAQIITMFGEETLLVAFFTFVLWCVDKRKGFAMGANILCVTAINSTIKAIVKYPRPWTMIEELDPLRVHTATGYSFPSGHTSSSAVTYTSLALVFGKRAVSVISAILILLIGLSRLYLGVHWPLDVAAGLIIGVVFPLTMWKVWLRIYDDKKKLCTVSTVIGAVFTAFALVFALIMTFGNGDPWALNDYAKNLALGGGAFLGFAAESRKIKYILDQDTGKKVLRYILGLAGCLVLQLGLKAIFPTKLIFDFIRYFSIGVWITWLYPFIGVKAGLFRTEE